MLMPPHIRETFVPNPPLKSIPPIRHKRKNEWTGVHQFLAHFETSAAPKRVIQPTQEKKRPKVDLKPKIEAYHKEKHLSKGGMNCYNTLFVGRLAYEVNERKLLREMETFGPIKDLKLIADADGKSRGYAFVEYENEDDMKRAYRAADGMKIEGRAIVVDVERGHTVPTWLPRKLGGGLGGTRLGGVDKNVTIPGRFDPSRPMQPPMGGGPPGGMMMGGHHGMGRGQGPPPMGYGGGGGGRGPPGGPPYGGGGGGFNGGGPGGYGRGRGDGDRKRYQRDRSPSPGRGRYAPRPRY